jgi:putative FmdB family regulatory protein
MPLYQYKCEKCRHEFELLIFKGDKPQCPKCDGCELTRLPTTFAVHGVSGGSSSGKSCGSCPPGHSCSHCH